MNKYCKTCKNFKDEDADDYGWCELQQAECFRLFRIDYSTAFSTNAFATD